MKHSQNKPLKAFILLVFAIICLLATHLGEFWPFSIYPMFSKGGKPWQRAIVIKMPVQVGVNALNQSKWDTLNTLEPIKNSVIELSSYNIAQNDFANFLHKVTLWEINKQKALYDMFNGVRADSLMIYKVKGRLNDKGGIQYSLIPMMFIHHTSWEMNPTINPTNLSK